MWWGVGSKKQDLEDLLFLEFVYKRSGKESETNIIFLYNSSRVINTKPTIVTCFASVICSAQACFKLGKNQRSLCWGGSKLIPLNEKCCNDRRCNCAFNF